MRVRGKRNGRTKVRGRATARRGAFSTAREVEKEKARRQTSGGDDGDALCCFPQRGLVPQKPGVLFVVVSRRLVATLRCSRPRSRGSAEKRLNCAESSLLCFPDRNLSSDGDQKKKKGGKK